MLDSESGEVNWINTQISKVRKSYSLYYQEYVSLFDELFKKNGAGALNCRLDESYVKKLLSYFKSRGK